ncbi:MAG: hypothetical protein AAF658_14675, partial [Myxococcota bacterium]
MCDFGFTQSDDDATECITVTCIPDCDAKQCGDDGCGGTCGACGIDEFCSLEQLCQTVGDSCPEQADCSGRACGPDPVCGTSCGTCDDEANAVCTLSAQCGCEPFDSCSAALAAANVECGVVPDGCGGSIDCGGVCAAPESCGGAGVVNACGDGNPLDACFTCDGACGAVDDNCGNVLDCGPCEVGFNPVSCGELVGGTGLLDIDRFQNSPLVLTLSETQLHLRVCDDQTGWTSLASTTSIEPWEAATIASRSNILRGAVIGRGSEARPVVAYLTAPQEGYVQSQVRVLEWNGSTLAELPTLSLPTNIPRSEADGTEPAFTENLAVTANENGELIVAVRQSQFDPDDRSQSGNFVGLHRLVDRAWSEFALVRRNATNDNWVPGEEMYFLRWGDELWIAWSELFRNTPPQREINIARIASTGVTNIQNVATFDNLATPSFTAADRADGSEIILSWKGIRAELCGPGLNFGVTGSTTRIWRAEVGQPLTLMSPRLPGDSSLNRGSRLFSAAVVGDSVPLVAVAETPAGCSASGDEFVTRGYLFENGEWTSTPLGTGNSNVFLDHD